MNLGPGEKTILLMAGFVIVVAGLRFGEPLLVPLFLALVIATVSSPIIRWLEKRRVPSALAIILAIVLDLAVLAALGTLVGSSLSDFSEAAPRYQAALSNLIKTNVAWLAARGVPASSDLLAPLQDFGRLVDLLGGLVKSVANVVSMLLFVLLLVVFMLVEFGRWQLKIGYALGDRHADLSRFGNAARELQKYLGVKTAANAVTGLLCGVWAAIMGVDFPILWGLIAFLLNYIPTIGTIIAAIPPIVLAWLAFGPGTAFVTAVGFVVINVTLGNVIEPRIMGRALGLSPLVVLISMVFWWWLWGPVGALLSAPLTMMVKIMLANTTDLRWLAIMLGSPSWVEEMQAQWDGARPVEHKSELCVRSEKPAHEVLLGVRATDPPRDPSATPYAIPRSPE
ncbi:MAG TPA: AI-2E family transporter [Polyangiaceae bacterium]|jgi:predicted PurR-regulated permease PerM|nr:MAG: AI-2 transport protein TqsA [Deltaproteobacteria bacterium ADurb.Bin207]HNS97536.1 AI-2E family transporter [Polyangiaceae bacterium]HNZ23254.1 AI-2E family transporter [Polyangiaceae bacterium]HOD23312.1 AI-2E family transporter [Polyangiaceae bacterium]HOE50597.1 AI-2E family transporter [Polyangiaceae bacterium]